MEQREIDNMLLSMIQKHFPSLPLSDEHTDWGKWLGFARAVYGAGRANPASAPEGFALVPVVPTHAILDVMFNAGIDRHDGDLTLLYRAILAAASPPVSEDRKDAEWVCAIEVRLIEIAGMLPGQGMAQAISVLRQRVTDKKWELLRDDSKVSP